MKQLLIICVLLSLSSMAAEIPVLAVGGRTYTNATIRAIDSTTGIVWAGTIGAKISLSELPEPYRSQYYDEAKVKRECELAAAIKAEKDAAIAARKKEEEEAKKTAEARATAAILESQKPSFKNEHIEISKTKATADRVGGMTISGVLKNLSGKERNRLVITFSVYDEGGSKIDTATDIISSLSAGESWQFEATTLTKVGKYSLEKVTCSAGRLD